MSRKRKNDVSDLRELTRTRADWKIGPGAVSRKSRNFSGDITL